METQFANKVEAKAALLDQMKALVEMIDETLDHDFMSKIDPKANPDLRVARAMLVTGIDFLSA